MKIFSKPWKNLAGVFQGLEKHGVALSNPWKTRGYPGEALA